MKQENVIWSLIGKVCRKYIVIVSARTKLGTVVQYLWTALVFGD